MAISHKDARILWGRAAGHCSRPSCRKTLTVESSESGAYHVGEHAHIIADSPAGPRGDELTDTNTDAYENHILLCPTCHREIDKAPDEFSPDLLRQWKREHESWVLKSLKTAIQYVSFLELNQVCVGVVSSIESSEGITLDLTLIPPLEKMKRNGLTTRTQSLIALGLSQAAHVRDFLEDIEEMDPNFPDRLVEGFKREYHLGLADGLSGDDLFQHLATHRSSDLNLQAAQLAVTSYLFHACDLFES